LGIFFISTHALFHSNPEPLFVDFFDIAKYEVVILSFPTVSSKKGRGNLNIILRKISDYFIFLAAGG
jgi:hypothetical protein